MFLSILAQAWPLMTARCNHQDNFFNIVIAWVTETLRLQTGSFITIAQVLCNPNRLSGT